MLPNHVNPETIGLTHVFEFRFTPPWQKLIKSNSVSLNSIVKQLEVRCIMDKVGQ